MGEVFIIILSLIVFLVGFLMFLSGMAEQEDYGFLRLIFGIILVFTSIFINYGLIYKYKKKEIYLLKYIVDNNLTNKDIENKFKKEIFEIKKAEAIQKLKQKYK